MQEQACSSNTQNSRYCSHRDPQEKNWTQLKPQKYVSLLVCVVVFIVGQDLFLVPEENDICI